MHALKRVRSRQKICRPSCRDCMSLVVRRTPWFRCACMEARKPTPTAVSLLPYAFRGWSRRDPWCCRPFQHPRKRIVEETFLAHGPSPTPRHHNNNLPCAHTTRHPKPTPKPPQLATTPAAAPSPTTTVSSPSSPPVHPTTQSPNHHPQASCSSI